MFNSPPRVAIFTHDAFGLGHIRRSSRILNSLAAKEPNASLLLITGSPFPGLQSLLPQNADYIKIPSIATSGTTASQPPLLPIGMAETIHLRERVTLAALDTFDPDVFLVDNFPLGSQRELFASLQMLRTRGTKLVLGMRDVLDPPRRVLNDWSWQGIYPVLERFFERILVYGTPDILDVAEAYELPPSVRAKITYCGYVASGERAETGGGRNREDLGFEGPFLLATAGGGSDGYPLLAAFIESFGLLNGSYSAVVTTGPLMDERDRGELCSQAQASDGIKVVDHLRDLPGWMEAASLVVAMGGYNTTAEILRTSTPAIIVPRTWRSGEHDIRASQSSGSDQEQEVRATALARMGLVRTLEARSLTAAVLAAAMQEELEKDDKRPADALNLGGVEVASEILLSLARERAA